MSAAASCPFHITTRTRNGVGRGGRAPVQHATPPGARLHAASAALRGEKVEKASQGEKAQSS